MSIVLLTPTGGRSKAFSLCQRYMARQTVPFNDWVVVDDCEPKTDVTNAHILVPSSRTWKEGDNSQKANLLLGLKLILNDTGYERIFFIEDDDWYGPSYLRVLDSLLDDYPIAGLCQSFYYNVKSRRYKQIDNRKHASLCATAFRRELLIQVIKTVESAEKYIDIDIWSEFKRLGILVGSHGLHVGIKGMPGRPGIGGGHKVTNASWKSFDKRLGVLRDRIGLDYKFYGEFYEEG